MKVVKWMDDHFEEFFLVIFLVLISCVTLVNVIVRSTDLIPALTWAEEFCRFCWIGSVFLSLPYTIRKGSMLRVSVLLDLFPHFARKVINILVAVVTTVSMGLLGYYSIEVLSNIIGSGETSPAMVWPMWTVYSTMLIGFALGTLRGVQQIFMQCMKINEKELSTIEQTMAEAADEAAAGKRAEGGEV